MQRVVVLKRHEKKRVGRKNSWWWWLLKRQFELMATKMGFYCAGWDWSSYYAIFSQICERGSRLCSKYSYKPKKLWSPDVVSVTFSPVRLCFLFHVLLSFEDSSTHTNAAEPSEPKTYPRDEAIIILHIRFWRALSIEFKYLLAPQLPTSNSRIS